MLYVFHISFSNTFRNNINRVIVNCRVSIFRIVSTSIFKLTKENKGMCVNIAVNYGGRDEITRAARQIAANCLDHKINPDEINDELFSMHLDTAGFPDPELLIRTSGEMRLSNFMLWQCAYSELYFSEKLWPDYKIEDLLAAVDWFQNRKRRFGGR